ncbi:uncharacterized protein LOC129597258 [Paramacrobiotus metropolitanus]|uniref:uncharacterized protein LOC129597258 n=1 Tax=Paramacrobiotus metropolitanus TaxID=2943436 RepID=UPI002446029F|nr:uncharacterized protein LOC129597258 [Paramacrobiotus metropolitanus]
MHCMERTHSVRRKHPDHMLGTRSGLHEIRRRGDLSKLMNGLDINDTRLVDGLCLLAPSIGKCINEFGDRCQWSDMDDLHEFMDVTLSLTEICKLPTVKSMSHQAYECLKAMSSPSSKFKTCATDLGTFIGNAMSNAAVIVNTLVAHNVSILKAVKSASVVTKTCCGLDMFRDCMGFDGQAECSIEGAMINSQLFEAIFTAYKCEEKLDQCDDPAHKKFREIFTIPKYSADSDSVGSVDTIISG